MPGSAPHQLVSSTNLNWNPGCEAQGFGTPRLAHRPSSESVSSRHRRTVSSRSRAAPSFLSLFSGCGGLDLGFRTAGYRCLHAYDIDAAAVATYNYNFGPSSATVADLSGDFLNSATVRPDVVIAGPPCQGFSTVGRRDPDDVRNHLLLKPVELAIRICARVLLVENVRGVLSGPHARYWNEAILQLTGSGYTTATLQVTATSAGLAQIRRRVVLIAARGSSIHRGKSPSTHGSPSSRSWMFHNA